MSPQSSHSIALHPSLAPHPEPLQVLSVALAGDHVLELRPSDTLPTLHFLTTLAQCKGPLTPLQITQLASTRNHPAQPDSTERPLRAPHCTASRTALLGTTRRPGETALAHGGLLVLDEWHRVPTTVLNDIICASLQQKTTHISVHEGRTRVRTWPTDIQVILLTPPIRPLPIPRRQPPDSPIDLQLELNAIDTDLLAHTIAPLVATARKRALDEDGTLSARLPPLKLDYYRTAASPTARVQLDASASPRRAHSGDSDH